jgi:hypothetical protein
MNTQKVRPLSFNLDSDFIGAVASVLCIVHCLLTPLLFVAHSTVVLSCAEIGPMWWKMIDFIFLAITYIAIYYTAKSTVLRWVSRSLYLLWYCLALLVINKFFQFVGIPDVVLYVPGLALCVLHLYNRNYCRCQERITALNESM